MKENTWIDESVDRVISSLTSCNRCLLNRKNRREEYRLPDRKAVHEVLDTLIGVLFPGCHGHGPVSSASQVHDLKAELRTVVIELRDQIETAFKYKCEVEDCTECNTCVEKADSAVRHLLDSLPDVQAQLQDDIQAAYDGDPAAKSQMEVVMSYPAIQAISTYRVAHVLYGKDVPLIPRIMTELAHSRTGIDIHPGAVIGRRFFIDHGTGVVIGETAVIGNNVKIYQGVTLGAMSFPKGDDGLPIKGIKRHPNVCDNVTIYAEATILGDITIGEGTIIGGNVWLTHSVEPFSKVSNVQPSPNIE